jgi:2-phospho-L-lactate guanylyltransferase
VQAPSPTAIVIPVRSLEGAKLRLGAVLDAEERRELVEHLLRRTVAVAIATTGVTRVLVVSSDPEALDVALASGAETLRQTSAGLNPGLAEARVVLTATDARRMLVLPGDLPAASSDSLSRVLQAADGAYTSAGVVVLVPDRHGRGTNVLLLDPADIIEPTFGGDSRDAHARLAADAGAAYREVEDDDLALDLDTPDDLLLAEALHPEVLLAG